MRMAVPGGWDRVEWYGLGPHQSYRDSRASVRVGRYAMSVDDLLRTAGNRQGRGA